jgi:nitroreductase
LAVRDAAPALNNPNGTKMTDATLFDTIYNCRAMRRLDTRDVPESDLLKLVDAANQAASGSNAQNGRWLVVRSAAVKQQLADLNRKFVIDYVGPPDSQPEAETEAEGRHKRMISAVYWQMEHMHELPALIVACLEYGEKVDGADLYRGAGDIWPGIQNLLLSARALGLGATPTTLALTDQDAARKVLNLPDTMAAMCLIPVGYPLGKFGPVTRKPVEEVMRFDTWS